MILYNRLKQLNLCRMFSHITIKHVLAILISVFSSEFKGKTVNIEQCSPCHRTTVAHFLNHGKWDDTISSKTKPSSRALHPIEDAYFHQSHLKRKQDYGHQVVAVMLSCNGFLLNYAMVLYDKSKSKIQIVQNIVEELPVPPVLSYFLCDSWYASTKVMDAFIKKGFYTVGALKVNRIIYPCGIKQKISVFALHVRKSDTNVHLVTVGSRQYYVYRYEGNLNGLENAVVLMSYPKEAFHHANALWAFVCTDVSLSTREILDTYVERWPIELFFRTSKRRLAFD